MLLNKEQLNKIIKEVVSDIKRDYGSEIFEIFLFGSYAKGKERNGSDIDILVVLEKSSVKIPDLLYAGDYSKASYSKYGVYVNITFEMKSYYDKGIEEVVKDAKTYAKKIG